MYLPSHLMRIINTIESKVVVDHKFLNVDLWPVLRNTIMTLSTHNIVKPKAKVGVKEKIKSVLDFFGLFFRVSPKDILVVTDYKFSTSVGGGLSFRESSILCDEAASLGESSLLLTQGVRCVKSRGESSLFFVTAIAYLLSNLLVLTRSFSAVSSYVSDVIESIESLDEDFNNKCFDQKIIVRNVFVVVVSSFIFRLLLKRLAPKKCYIVCYYSLIGMALCSACNKLGIPIIDLQHGVSGRNMRAYGDWKSVSEAGYNTLPSVFHCWSEFDKKAIDLWAVNSSGRHQAVVKGNIWRDFFVSSDAFQQSMADHSFFEKELSGFQRVVLISTQASILPYFFVELLKQAPKDYAFLIRLHPNVDNGNLVSIESEVRKVHPSCFVVRATELPIQQVIRYSNVHLTEWSAVVYDSMFEGVKSIVTTEVGRDYFIDFIDAGLVSYSNNVGQLLLKLGE